MIGRPSTLQQRLAWLVVAVFSAAPANALPPPRPPSIEPPLLPEVREAYPDLPYPGPRPHPVAWTTDGVAICNAPGEQTELSGTDDLAHGAYFVWRDERSGEPDIYATRILPDGTRAPGWVENGTPVCVALGVQSAPRVVTDRASGAWVVWSDERDGVAALYVQRLEANGTIGSGWPENGRRIAAVRGGASAWADMQGGLMLFWEEPGGAERQFRRLHIDAFGDPVAGLPPDGSVVFANENQQSGCSRWLKQYVSAFFRWPAQVGISVLGSHEDCEYPNCTGCYGFQINQTVVLDDRDLVVETQDWLGPYPSVIHDGSGGMLLVRQLMKRIGAYGHPSWQRYAPDGISRCSWSGDGFHALNWSSSGIRVLRIEDSGLDGPGWATQGVPFCVNCEAVEDPAFVHDGAGGVLLLWRSSTDLLASWIRRNSTYGWTSTGRAILHVEVVPSGTGLIGNRHGDAIAFWQDSRNGNADLWAYRLSYDAPPPSSSKPTRHAIAATASATPGLEFALDAITPNPSPGDLSVRFQLPHAGSASITVTDVAGRIAIRRTLDVSAGPHSVELARTSPLAPGVYLVRLEFAGAALTRRAVVVR